MCGIAGILTFKQELNFEKLKRMTDVISHRGPDGEGHWLNAAKDVALGHRRLSIIDLSDKAKQPMHYAEGRYTITFNGEIYNYIELKEQLIKKGYHFNSSSDTEVLLALYDLKKEKFLEDLDGMFALAIWDEKEQTLFCARDRFGEKPFYYSLIEGNCFYFASEMKSIWAAGIAKESDPIMVDRYLSTGSVTAADENITTFYKNIQQLEAAHYLVLDRDLKPLIVKYYDIDISNTLTISEDQAVEEFLSLFTGSVNLRLRADVPVGSSLSGGLDSSSIVMMIDRLKHTSTKQNSFSARFEDFNKDEGEYIHQVIEACENVQGHEVFPNGQQMSEVFGSLVYHQEEPFGSASIFAQWKVMELAKEKGVVVLLDGQGADEFLGGYLPFYGLYLNQLFYTNRKMYEGEFSQFSQLRGNIFKSIEDQETVSMKLGRIKRKILKQQMPYNSQSLRTEFKKHTLSAGLKELLRYADRNAMAHSREIRLPFLSHKLVDFVFKLPDHYKLYNGWTKYILRKSMEPILPKNICWRIDKVGYEPPQKDWLKSDFFQGQIAEGKKKHRDLARPQDPEKSDWQYIMINNFIT